MYGWTKIVIIITVDMILCHQIRILVKEKKIFFCHNNNCVVKGKKKFFPKKNIDVMRNMCNII